MLKYEVIYINKSRIKESTTVKAETVNELVVTIYQQLHAIDAEIVQLNWIETK